MTQPLTVAPEMIACIAEGRDATDVELARVIDRLAAEIGGLSLESAYAIAGDDMPVTLVERVARAAIGGSAVWRR